MRLFKQADPLSVMDGNIGGDSGDDFTHLFCECNDDVARCGLDVSGLPYADDDEEADCPLCIIANEDPCPRCGDAPTEQVGKQPKEQG